MRLQSSSVLKLVRAILARISFDIPPHVLLSTSLPALDRPVAHGVLA